MTNSTAAAYSYTIKFPETKVSTQVTAANEVSVSKKGIYTYEIEIDIQVFDSKAISGTGKYGQKHINYSEAIGKTSIVKENEGGELLARYKSNSIPSQPLYVDTFLSLASIFDRLLRGAYPAQIGDEC